MAARLEERFGTTLGSLHEGLAAVATELAAGENGYLPPSVNAVSYEDANNLFSAGLSGMDITGSWMIRTFKDTTFQSGIFFMPSMGGEAARP